MTDLPCKHKNNIILSCLLIVFSFVITSALMTHSFAAEINKDVSVMYAGSLVMTQLFVILLLIDTNAHNDSATESMRKGV